MRYGDYKMDNALILVSFVIECCLVIGIGSWLGSYYYYLHNSKCAVVTFNEFKSVFNVAPEKYCQRYHHYLIGYDCGAYEDEKYNIRISTAIGYIKAICLMRKRDRQNDKKKSLQNKQELTKLWKKDIEDYKQKAYADITKQLKENSIALFSDLDKEIIEEAVKNLYKELGEEAAKKAAEEAVNTIEIHTVASNG